MILRLHHIGNLVAEIPAAAEIWVSRFGYTIESPLIEDSAQTALVQFLRQPGSPYWLELVSPNGPRSVLSAALRKGERLHHLCYETEDIEGACRHLRGEGMFLISRPVPAVAFAGRRICWLTDRGGSLVELVEEGGELSLASITAEGVGTRDIGGREGQGRP